MALTVTRLLTLITVTDNGCWVWKGNIRSSGYGRYGQAEAHRVVYEMWKRKIPKGKVLHHLCENPPCVNPDHLKPVTRKEHQDEDHAMASKWRGKTECPKGHPYDEKNTRIEKRSDGGVARRCRTCERERAPRKTPPGASNHDRALANTCKRGHDLRDAWVDRNGTRKCRACRALLARERRAGLR